MKEIPPAAARVRWAAFAGAVARLESRISAWPRAGFLACGCVVTLVLTLLWWSPDWKMLLLASPDSHEWYRGLGFLAQCADPWRTDVEPALRARLLAPLIAHSLGLGGNLPLGIGWAGVLVLLVQTLRWLERETGSRVAALAFTVAMAGTSAVLVPVHWVGLNDAWVWLGLLAVPFSRTSWATPLACLLCPWIDERFIIGLPLALWAATELDPHRSLLRRGLVALVWLLPYFALRILLMVDTEDGSTGRFMAAAWSKLQMAAVWAPLGWWLGLRAGWVLCGYALLGASRGRRLAFGTAALAAAVGASTFLAHDFSRSVAIVLPSMALGAVVVCRSHRENGPATLVLVAAANLLLPSAHLVERKLAPIVPLPIELLAPGN